MREFWLASEHRDTPALVGAEAATADEAFEAVASAMPSPSRAFGKSLGRR